MPDGDGKAPLLGSGTASAPLINISTNGSASSRSSASGPADGTRSEPIRRRRESEVRRSFDIRAFMPERVNIEISRRYDIDAREIGSGGYGKVFVAKDREVADRLVAIKKVIVFDEDKKAAFQKEVLIMKDLDHPNICKLLETYEQGRFMFFVMEYCEGGEVFDRIMEHGMIAEHTTADIVKQVASALLYAHNRGIAHRDMKPENVCFCSEDVGNTTVKVIDWGLGFYFGQARMSSAVGSLTYAAPEVLEAKDYNGYTSACDLWSLGVVTYVMLCGKPPFWGTYTEQLKRMKKEQYPMSDATWQSISKEAKDFIAALLKTSPQQRLSLEGVLAHPWLRKEPSHADPLMAQQVLCNLRQFSNTSHFFSICVASVARQLDHRSLRDVHRVFCEMDTNGDGVLELNEVRTGFEKIFGKDSEQLKDIEGMFARLDLDDSGTIDYTEFCAAGIGERLSTEEHVLWAAFKSFDLYDDDGKITKEEIKQVLTNADVKKVWGPEVCERVADEIFERFDQDGDGQLDFQEWLRLMREYAHKRKETEWEADEDEAQEQELLVDLHLSGRGLGKSGFDAAYGLLTEMERKSASGSKTPSASFSPDKKSLGGTSPKFFAGSDEDRPLYQTPARIPQGAAAATPGQSSRQPASATRSSSWPFGRNNSNTPACFMCSSSEGRAQQCVVM